MANFKPEPEPDVHVLQCIPDILWESHKVIVVTYVSDIDLQGCVIPQARPAAART